MQNTNHIETKTNTAPRQWLVAYVQSCLEKKTAQRLAAMGIECYLPVQSEIRQWSDRRKRVDRLVIPMMIFVHVTPQERPLPLSLQAVSRYMVLRGESTPAVIPDEQMDRFRFMLDYSPEAVEMCSAPLAPGDAVKVIKGPLAGLEGELITVNGKSKVAVRLDMLGCAHVDVPIGFVEKKGEGMEGQKNKKQKRHRIQKRYRRGGNKKKRLYDDFTITLQPFQHPAIRIPSLHQSRDIAWSTPWVPLLRFRSGRD